MTLRLAIGVLGLSLLAAGSSAGVFAEDEEIYPVVGRWNVLADTGGAVWTFQPDGQLLLIGPGEIISDGTWTPATAGRGFDAEVAVEITGQQLAVSGEVSPDLRQVTLRVAATEPVDPSAWTPWPPESHLCGDRFSMLLEAEAPSSAEPIPSADPMPSADPTPGAEPTLTATPAPGSPLAAPTLKPDLCDQTEPQGERS